MTTGDAPRRAVVAAGWRDRQLSSVGLITDQGPAQGISVGSWHPRNTHWRRDPATHSRVPGLRRVGRPLSDPSRTSASARHSEHHRMCPALVTELVSPSRERLLCAMDLWLPALAIVWHTKALANHASHPRIGLPKQAQQQTKHHRHPSLLPEPRCPLSEKPTPRTTSPLL